jgi:SNF2 family DNA or RNA helicase
VQGWNEYIAKLEDRHAEICDDLCSLGFDVDKYYTDTLLKPMLAEAQNDPAEIQLRQTVDKMLDKLRPVERTQRGYSCTERRPVGACHAYGKDALDDDEEDEDDWHMEEDEELANGVEVLDSDAPLLENDKMPDVANIYDESDDAMQIEKPKLVEETGAYWYNGFRVSASVVKNLKYHQIELMCFLLDAWSGNRGALCAHSMGLGKSLAFLCAFDVWSSKYPKARAVVTAPLSMVPIWALEVDRWESLLPYVVDITAVTRLLEHHTRERAVRKWKRNGGIIVVNHEYFSKVAFDIDESCIFVVDEAHSLKNPKTDVYKDFSFDKVMTQKRVFMTGTPIQNHLWEYYAMVQLLAPGLLGKTKSEFRKKYSRVIEKGMLKDSTEKEISECEKAVQVMRWRMSEIMHERSSELLYDHIPAKNEFRISHPCDDIELDENLFVELRNVESAACKYKVITAVSLIDCIHSIDPSDAILVFSPRTEHLKAIQEVRDGFLFTGSLSSDNRTNMIDEFNREGGIMYITTNAGGVGITLHRANHVIVLNPDWNPMNDEQAIARAWRIGQEKEVTVYRLIAEGTLQERIYRLCVQKHALAARVIQERISNRLYGRDDLMTLTENELCTPVDASVLVKNPVLAAISHNAHLGLTIYCHDSLFNRTHASLTAEQEYEAKNDFYGIMSQHPRMLTNSDGETQLVPVGQMFFFTPDGEEGTELVPAYTPSYSSISGRMISFSNLGPSMFFETQMRELHKTKWQPPERNRVDNELTIALPRAGIFVFRMRVISDNFELGPWSDESVPICISE